MARAYLKTEEALEDLIGSLRKFRERKSELVAKVSRENKQIREWMEDCVRNRERELRSVSEQLDDAEESLSRDRSDDARDKGDSAHLIEAVNRLRYRREVADEKLRTAKRTQQELDDKIAQFQHQAQGFQQASDDSLMNGVSFVEARLSAALQYTGQGGGGVGGAPSNSSNVASGSPATNHGTDSALAAIPYAYSDETKLLRDVHAWLQMASIETNLHSATTNPPPPHDPYYPISEAASRIRAQVRERGGDASALTDEEVIAINAYTSPYPPMPYRNLNQALCDAAKAGGAPAEGEGTFAFAYILQRGLSKLPDYTGVVVRHTDAVDKANVIGAWSGDTEIGIPKFLSASKRRGVLDTRPIKMFINCTHAKDVSIFSFVPDEQEVVFLAGTRFANTLEPQIIGDKEISQWQEV